MAIRIITDSTSDISLEEAKQLGISIVPLKVIFGSKEYKEGIEISIDEFYKKLVESEELPTTSQPAPDEFLTYYKEAKEAGDSVITLCISSKLSGTFQSAQIAKDMADYKDIYIIDSLSTTVGLRLLVEEAIKLRDKGESFEKIIDKIEALKERIVFFVLADTLKYLHKGGRVSFSSNVIGSLLQFKPIITLKNGLADVAGKARGSKNGYTKVVELVEEYGQIDFDYPVIFGFTANDNNYLTLKDKIMEKYKINENSVHPVGCVIGTHVGPGSSIITYIKK